MDPPAHSRKANRLQTILWTTLSQALVAPALFAAETVLILNSDVSVERYQIAQDAFKQTVSRSTIQIDLGSRFADERQTERQIRQAKAEIIYCIGSKAYLLAHKLDQSRNIVISSAINLKRLPLGNRTYGIANELPAATQLTYFRYFFPEVKRVGMLYSTAYNKESFDEAVAAGRDIGIQVTGAQVGKAADLRRALAELLSTVDAVWLISDPLVLSGAQSAGEIFRQADAAKKPIFTFNPAFVDLGAVLAISPDTSTIGRQAAGLVTELLNAKKIADRFQEPAGSEIILNLRKVSQYGLKLNEDALSSVNRIVR